MTSCRIDKDNKIAFLDKLKGEQLANSYKRNRDYKVDQKGSYRSSPKYRLDKH